MNDNEIKHKENRLNGVFYLRDEEGILCELTYKMKDGKIMVIDHTETRQAREGEGLASLLLEKAVGFAREKSYKIDPLCPFVEVKFDENKDYQKLRV